jgi:putative addiction module killer protein
VYPVGYTLGVRIGQTGDYSAWFARLRDVQARARIDARLRRIGLHGGLLGDYEHLGSGVTELKFHFGPGYRIYVTARGSELLALLTGGDKSTQETDIARAKRPAKELED